MSELINEQHMNASDSHRISWGGPLAMREPRYRWSHPYAWLEHASVNWDRDRLLRDLRRLALQCDSDTLQDLFQEDMNSDGYFEPLHETPCP